MEFSEGQALLIYRGAMSASYEVVIRAIDDHFFPSEAAAPAEPSADLDSL